MNEKELQQILYALQRAFGEKEARRLFIKLVHILFD